MNFRKRLLIFTDLEGTILRESDGKYDSENMYAYLSQISQLQKATGLESEIHIVSPMLAEDMKRVLDRIDKDISRYNTLHSEDTLISQIAGATVSPETPIEDCCRLDNRMMPMPKQLYTITDATYGKLNYVKYWKDIASEKNRFGMIIYCGNGRNDIAAAKFIKANKLGYVVSPRNTKTELKEIADHVSTKEDLPGITEGLAYVLQRISKKEEKQAEESYVQE